MGAETFTVYAKGKNAKKAFSHAVSDAAYENGNGGYTGTIAEKSSFQLIVCPPDVSPFNHAQDLMKGDNNHWVQDKWGPAGCIHLGSDDYLFFGWASS